MTVNRARRGQACESFFSQIQRGMSNAQSLARAEQSEPAHVAALGYGGTENVDLQLVIIEEAECFAVAEFQAAEKTRRRGTAFFQSGFRPVTLDLRNPRPPDLAWNVSTEN